MPHFHIAKVISDSDSDITKKMVQNYFYRFDSVETILSDTMIPIASDISIAIALWKWGITLTVNMCLLLYFLFFMCIDVPCKCIFVILHI